MYHSVWATALRREARINKLVDLGDFGFRREAVRLSAGIASNPAAALSWLDLACLHLATVQPHPLQSYLAMLSGAGIHINSDMVPRVLQASGPARRVRIFYPFGG
jgi:hypothetical protein